MSQFLVQMVSKLWSWYWQCIGVHNFWEDSATIEPHSNVYSFLKLLLHLCKFWKLELEILHPGLCLGWPVDYTLHRMWDKMQFSESSCTKVRVGYKWFFWPCLAAIQSFNKAQIAVNWIGRLMNNVLWFDSMGISVILRALFSCFLCGTMWCCLQSDWPKLSYLVLFQHITCKYVSKQWAKMC
jgi:hypothetical protein